MTENKNRCKNRENFKAIIWKCTDNNKKSAGIPKKPMGHDGPCKYNSRRHVTKVAQKYKPTESSIRGKQRRRWNDDFYNHMINS
jgi:hypothetical protein